MTGTRDSSLTWSNSCPRFDQTQTSCYFSLQILHFNVSLRIVEDGNYGSFDGHRWNGMIEEVLDRRADMAVADLSVTTARMEAVKFSMPWMNIGISIIYMKPKKAAPGLLTFMDPFHDSVWFATLVSILLTAMFTFIIGR